MKSGTGEYCTTIRRCRDLSYNIEIFAVYKNGERMGLNCHHGPANLEIAQRIAREWMFDYEMQNTFQEIEGDDKALRDGIKNRTSMKMLRQLAKDFNCTVDKILDDAVSKVREYA